MSRCADEDIPCISWKYGIRKCGFIFYLAFCGTGRIADDRSLGINSLRLLRMTDRTGTARGNAAVIRSPGIINRSPLMVCHGDKMLTA